MIFPTGSAVPLGTRDRGFALLKGVGAGRNILKIMCAYDHRVKSYMLTF